jgi:hypothetical protein
MSETIKRIAEEVFKEVRTGGDYLTLTHEKFREHKVPVTPENRGFYIHQVLTHISMLP